MNDQTETRRGKLRDLVRQELADVDLQLDELEPQVAALRAARTEALRMLKIVEPDAPELEPATKSKRDGRHARIAQANVDQLADWLRDHADEFPDGFTIPELTGYDGIPMPGKSALTHALPALLDQGVVRADGLRAKKPDGSAIHGRRPKIYALVSQP